MKVELKKRRIDGDVLYFWYINDQIVSPAVGHGTLSEAKEWYKKWTSTTVHDFLESKDIRQQNDRRNATRKGGRRWTDQLKKYDDAK